MIKGLITISIFILIVATFLTGCSFGKANLPALDQQADINSDGNIVTVPGLDQTIDESPRTGSGVEIPPTWTPGAPEIVSEAPQPTQPISTIEPVASETTTYVVKAGDTLAEIAERFSVTLEQLAVANNIEDVDHIETGQELLIPSP